MKLRDSLCTSAFSGDTSATSTPRSLKRRQYTHKQALDIVAEAGDPCVPASVVAANETCKVIRASDTGARSSQCLDPTRCSH
jgi:hypothetical protein